MAESEDLTSDEFLPLQLLGFLRRVQPSVEFKDLQHVELTDLGPLLDSGQRGMAVRILSERIALSEFTLWLVRT